MKTDFDCGFQGYMLPSWAFFLFHTLSFNKTFNYQTVFKIKQLFSGWSEVLSLQVTWHEKKTHLVDKRGNNSVCMGLISYAAGMDGSRRLRLRTKVQ